MIRETDIDKLKVANPIRRTIHIRSESIDFNQSLDGLIDDLEAIKNDLEEGHEGELNVWSSYGDDEVEGEVIIRGSERIGVYETRISYLRDANIRLNKQDFDRYLAMRKEYGDGNFIKNFE